MHFNQKTEEEEAIPFQAQQTDWMTLIMYRESGTWMPSGGYLSRRFLAGNPGEVILGEYAQQDDRMLSISNR